MAEHVHHYKVTKDSVFGLVHVNAVMRCDGMVNRVRCPAKLVKMLTYGELEKRGETRVTYFYREPAMANTGGITHG